jgi:hypothetical protein
MLNKLIASADTGGGSFIETIHNPIVGDGSTGTSGNAGVTFLQKAIPAAITMGLVIGVIIFFFILITGAIQWISSGGDKQAVEGARGKVTNAIIGLIVLFAVFAIIQIINTFFGIKLLELTLPTLGNKTTGS